MLSVLGVLLILTDCMVIPMSNVSGGSFSSSCSVSVSFACALSRGNFCVQLLSPLKILKVSFPRVLYIFFIGYDLILLPLHIFVWGLKPSLLNQPLCMHLSLWHFSFFAYFMGYFPEFLIFWSFYLVGLSIHFFYMLYSSHL